MPYLIDRIREQFPALRNPYVYLDGPAGSQVPQIVIDAIGQYLVKTNANHGGHFPTSAASDGMLAEAHRAAADLLGTDDPGTVAFGANMTTLTFALSRSLGRTWKPGDEVIVTQIDHDANVTPWTLAARDAGATVRTVRIRPDDCTLDLDDMRSKFSARTRLVAVSCASNAVGTINPVKEIVGMARGVGALVFLDAVHYAPHCLIDVPDWGCDFLACSAYKFFGPHVGILWGQRKLMESLEAYKLRPPPNTLPDKWMTGTQNHECIAGVLAAINYLAALGRDAGAAPTRRHAIRHAYHAIKTYEQSLTRHFLKRLQSLPQFRLWGISDPSRLDDRVATFALTHRTKAASELASHLGERGICSWHGNYYALNLTQALGLEPHGMLRIGLLHYNTTAEIDRLFDELAKIL